MDVLSSTNISLTHLYRNLRRSLLTILNLMVTFQRWWTGIRIPREYLIFTFTICTNCLSPSWSEIYDGLFKKSKYKNINMSYWNNVGRPSYKNGCVNRTLRDVYGTGKFLKSIQMIRYNKLHDAMDFSLCSLFIAKINPHNRVHHWKVSRTLHHKYNIKWTEFECAQS